MPSLLDRLYEYIQYYFGKIRVCLLRLRGIKIGRHTIIECGAVLRMQYGGNISIGNSCYLSRGCQVITHGGGAR